MDTNRAIPLGIGQSSTAMKTIASSAPLATLRAMVASACLRAAALAGTGTRLRVGKPCHGARCINIGSALDLFSYVICAFLLVELCFSKFKLLTAVSSIREDRPFFWPKCSFLNFSMCCN